MGKTKQNNRKFKIYAILMFIGVITSMLLRVNYKAYHKKSLRIGDKLPEVCYTSGNQKYIVKNKSMKPIVLFVYKSDCPYCEMTLKEINVNMKDSVQALFYFLSHEEDSDCIRKIYSKLDEKMTIMFGQIDKVTLKDSLCVTVFPTIYIVDYSNIVREKIKGAVKFSIIDRAINKCGVLGLNKVENVPDTAGNDKLK
ncbi:MAG: TlpA family protein disulfide reductase [Fidelibacterota bacterium]